ncbi:MAG TPA: phosphonate ABC transporter, permease protein PhnE, partial [Desulfobulbaceae bacterium]|nr:phosphonate ABC transporter, permease protein PhnE [Desulfobulbaceae bacterium]
MSSLHITAPASIDEAQLKKSVSPFRGRILVTTGVLCLVFLASWHGTEMSLHSLLSGVGYMKEYLIGNPELAGSSFFPPSFIAADIKTYCLAMLETLEMAVVALFLSVLVAVPLSLLASRNIMKILLPGRSMTTAWLRRTIYLLAVLIANVFRSINEIVWALFFVSAVGLGPMAGILALAVHTSGVL